MVGGKETAIQLCINIVLRRRGAHHTCLKMLSNLISCSDMVNLNRNVGIIK